MKTATSTTITGQVQNVKSSQDSYLIKFVTKVIKEGEEAWFNVTTSPWIGWNLKDGDQVTITGQLTSSVWEDPFLGEKITALEIDAHKVEILAA